MAAVTAGPSVYWYLTRASGGVSLILLTLSVVIGIAAIGRLHSASLPRFAIDGLHRTSSLLALAFLVAHILTAVLDSFAPITLVNAVVPFGALYRPLWLGLGAVAFDLLLAVIVTSLVRHRLGYSSWRAVHWLAYLSWPVALVHGLGTGSDLHQTWMLVIDVACTVAFLAAVVARVVVGWPAHPRLRVGALCAALGFVLGLAAWLPGGPFGRHWARRAGTPPALLAPSAKGSA
jgi:methionine sulfoxide reductase heme-binding subunit